MRKISAFTFLTLNGFYKGANEDTSWHQHGGESARYAEQSSQSGNVLLFGRRTYELMYSFWPTPMAAELFPVVATNMNRTEKIVFSNSLTRAAWTNTRVMSGNILEQVNQLRQTPGNDMTILGSGSIVTLFAGAGLIDEFSIMLDPVAIGTGTSLFSGLELQLNLKLKEAKVFESDGKLVLTYTR